MKAKIIVGFAGEVVENPPGVYKSTIVENTYYGDVLKNLRRISYNDRVMPDVQFPMILSIVGDQYAFEHYSNARYAIYRNTKWNITEITVEPPRLKLSLGGVYHGNEASVTQ